MFASQTCPKVVGFKIKCKRKPPLYNWIMKFKFKKNLADERDGINQTAHNSVASSNDLDYCSQPL